jgi:hypothetical protein
MSRIVALLGLLAVMLALVAGGYVAAQDTGTPTVMPSTCATPAGALESSPIAVIVGTPADVPGSTGAIAPSPAILYPCGTPSGDGS